jgi:hypothetical protein
MKHYPLVLACILSFRVAPVFASGMLIPKDESVPALAIESQRVDIRIRDGVATARNCSRANRR